MNPVVPEQPLNQRIKAAQAIILEAGQIALEYFENRQQLQIETKSDLQDVVSAADREVEAYIREGICIEFPEDGFLGEESGLEPGVNDWLWVTDPIDGTSCFLAGIPTWCLSIALLYQGLPVAGLVLDPNADELFSACHGRGAFVNDQPIFCHKATALEQGLMGAGTSHSQAPGVCTDFLQKLLNKGGMFIRNGSGALMICYVAAGRLIGYYEPHINSWDCLAGLVLVREAGGWTNNFLQGEGLLKGNPILAAAPGVEQAVRELVDL